MNAADCGDDRYRIVAGAREKERERTNDKHLAQFLEKNIFFNLCLIYTFCFTAQKIFSLLFVTNWGSLLYSRHCVAALFPATNYMSHLFFVFGMRTRCSRSIGGIRGTAGTAQDKLWVNIPSPSVAKNVHNLQYKNSLVCQWPPSLSPSARMKTQNVTSYLRR
jgi:hypothetical protein